LIGVASSVNTVSWSVAAMTLFLPRVASRPASTR
jgi:hypothetical protein